MNKLSIRPRNFENFEAFRPSGLGPGPQNCLPGLLSGLGSPSKATFRRLYRPIFPSKTTFWRLYRPIIPSKTTFWRPCRPILPSKSTFWRLYRQIFPSKTTFWRPYMPNLPIFLVLEDETCMTDPSTHMPNETPQQLPILLVLDDETCMTDPSIHKFRKDCCSHLMTKHA